MLRKGEDIDKIIVRFMLIISFKSWGEQVGGQYIRIIIMAGLWSLGINNSLTEFEYAKQMSQVVEFHTYTQTPPPVLDERSHLIIEKPEI